jgi:hypothetical protein
MPAKSEKQKQFMDAAAHNPKFAKAAGVPVSVAKEFSGASKGMKFGKGTNASRPDLQKINNPKTLHGKMSIMKEGGNTMATSMGKPVMKKGMSMAKDGMKRPTPMADTSMMGMKKGGMAEGGKSDMKQDKSMMQKAVNKHEGRLHKGAAMTKLSKGGGIESKGKTKGKMVKMNMGGKAC